MQDETIHKNNVRHPEHAENARKGGAHLIEQIQLRLISQGVRQ